jgi:hypothetical protein
MVSTALVATEEIAMAVVKGVKEKVHLPLYDSISVKSGRRLGDILTSNVMRFFLDVTGKTKLQTNMQAAALLPHWNTYEARALRVVISDLPVQAPDTPIVELIFDLKLGVLIDRTTSSFSNATTATSQSSQSKGTVRFNLRHFVDLKRRIEGPEDKEIEFNGPDTGNKRLIQLDLTITVERDPPQPTTPGDQLATGERFTIDRKVLKVLEEKFRQQAGLPVPTNEQIFPHDGFGTLIGKFVYNTVTTFFVGEKIMIQVPTYFFPAGAGPYSEDGRVTTHGYPNPQATFRFAEPVMIDAQQNFRVEIEVPESDVLSDLQRLYGPFFIWAVIDGYMTRDVQ